MSENKRPKHPAKYTKSIREVIREVVGTMDSEGGLPNDLVLDPMGGVGTIHEVLAGLGLTTVSSELEYHWTKQGADYGEQAINVQADCLHLPFAASTFGLVVKSPDYGNRFADHHHAKDGSTRRSYFHDYLTGTGDDLRPETSCKWSFTNPKYKAFHIAAHREVRRVLCVGGVYINNTSDFYKTVTRRGEKKVERMEVTAWHSKILRSLGMTMVGEGKVETARLKYGENRQRAEAEDVCVWMKIQGPLSRELEDVIGKWQMFTREEGK